jgi:hypothetical protein
VSSVEGLFRRPVVGMAGERVNALRLDGRGVGGDRIHAVLHDGRPVESLPGWHAGYPFNLDAGLDPARPPFAIVTAPDGHRYRWGDPRLRAALEDHLGLPVELARDLHAVRPVTRDAVRLDLTPPDGAVLRFAGGVRLLVANRAARVLTGGRIAVGEAVKVLHASGSGATGR